MGYIMGGPPNKPKAKPQGKGKPKKPSTPTQAQMSAATQAAFQRFLNALQGFNQGYGTTWSELNRLYPANQLGPVYNEAQLRAMAQRDLASIFKPRISQINESFARRGRAGTENITGYTGAYMGRLGAIAPQMAATTQQGLTQQAAVGGALADYMRNTGAELTGDLTARLEGANLSEGQLAGTVGTAGTTGFLGSGEIAGLSSASQLRMADEGNAWTQWANALPGLGMLQGQAELGKFQSQLNEGYLSQMGDLQSQMAEAGLSLYQSLADRDMQRRGLGLQRSQSMAGYLGDARQRQLNAALGGAGLMQSWAEMLLNRELGYAGLAQDRYETDVNRATTMAGLQNQRWISQHPIFEPPAPGEPGGAPAPIDKGAEQAGLVTAALQVFPPASENIDPMTGRPASIHNMRKKIMTWLRSQTRGLGFSEQELERIRNQILGTLGYSGGGSKKGPGASQAPVQPKPPYPPQEPSSVSNPYWWMEDLSDLLVVPFP